MIRHSLFIASLLLTTAACTSPIPPEAYFTHGTPESLLDVSSNVVNVSLNSQNDIDELTHWVEGGQPSRAELNCMQGDMLCNQAQNVLAQYDVPVQANATSDNTVTLVYEKVTARDCDPRFMSNSINPYNLNHPTYGCATAANMVQMISDKDQITNPGLLDPIDAQKATSMFAIYNTTPTKPKFNPILSTNVGSGGGSE